MTQFKAKLRRIGNSLGVLIPKQVITDYKEGDEIELVITEKGGKTVKIDPEVITGRKAYRWCDKHDSASCDCI